MINGAEFEPIECIGTTDSGTEVNIFRGALSGEMCVEIRHVNSGQGRSLYGQDHVVLPADQAPRLMILLSLAHEKATRAQRESHND
jgi:hypothetical protein